MSTKKLIVAPFKDMSGYAALARAYTRSLFLVEDKEQWSAASLKYDSGSKSPLPKDIVEAHKRPISSDIETVVQISTPNEMRAVPGKFNVAICCWETDRIPTHWAIQLNAFDRIIVPCEANKKAFEDSGVSKPITVIGMPVFKEDYSTEGLSKWTIPSITSDTTIYYNISQWSHKKGIDSLLRSYYLAFQGGEDVLLVLKGYIGMHNQSGDARKILQAIEEIKGAMRLSKYPRVHITDMILNEVDVKRLHMTGDCYVNTTRGEGWCIPAFEAALYGKELITTKHTAMNDWVNEKYVRIVESHKDSVHNMPHPDPYLYTGKENWYEPNILSGSLALKAHFNEMKKMSKEYAEELYTKYNPEVIGNQLKEVINV